MKLQTIVFLTGTILVTAGCAVSDPTFTRAGSTPEEASTAYEQCLYQAKIATANTGARPPKYDSKISDSVASGVADGIARGYEEGDLINHCMKIQGYKKS